MSAVLAQRFSPAIWPVRVLGLGLMLVLAACSPKQDADKASAPTAAQPALRSEPVQVTLVQPGCKDACARFSARWLRFPDAPKFDETILKDQGVTWKGDAESSLQAAASDFMSDAERQWEIVMALTLQRSALPDVAVAETTNYSFTGGAHGQDVLSFYNWDKRQGKLVNLRDWVLPGREKAFWARVKQAHSQWAARGSEPSMIDSGWPFVHSENMALLADGLAIRYNAYEIGPYSEGAPLLHVPYASLRDIFKPEWLPAP